MSSDKMKMMEMVHLCVWTVSAEKRSTREGALSLVTYNLKPQFFAREYPH